MANEAEKAQLREMLAYLHRQYQNSAKPYLDQLARLEAMEPPRPIMFHVDELPAILRQQLPAINKK